MEDVALGWLAEQLKVDLKAWEPTGAFLELYDAERLPALCRELGLDPKLGPAEVLAQWPRGVVPEDLRWVDHDGNIRRPKKAKKS